MQSIYKAVLIALTMGIFISCEEVINLDLKNTNPQIVIDAVISDNQEATVKISKSSRFYDVNNYGEITTASVVLTSNNGAIDTLVYVGNGTYKGSNLFGKQGESYTIIVEADGVIYTATNTIPYKTELDSIDYEWAENPHASGYMINMYFRDTPGISNYYRIKVFVDNILGRNQSEGRDYMLYEDKIFDGRNTKLPAIRGGELLKESDTVTVEMYSISKATFEYYNTLRNVVASKTSGSSSGSSMMNGSSAPANPTTNFNNGALGYFGAFCVSRKTVILRP